MNNFRARVWPTFALIGGLFFAFATWDALSHKVVRFRSRGLPPIKKEEDPQMYHFSVLFSSGMSVLMLVMSGREWMKRRRPNA